MTDAPGLNIIELVEKFQRALASKDAATLARLIDAYMGAYDNLRGKVEALALKLEQTGALSQGELVKLAQYKSLIDGVEREVTKYSVYLETELSATAKQAIALAGQNVNTILAELVAGDKRLVAYIQSLNPRVVETLLAFLSPEGELFRRLSGYGAEAARRISQAIIEHVTLGRNPKVLAASLVRDKLGMTLTDALRTARTVQLWSYREATRANYIANNKIVTGWIWFAHLPSACPACVAKHGTFHTVDERLDDHYSGRCAMLPQTILNPDFTIQTGEEWFSQQPEAMQKQILGKGKYEAWKAGKFNFADIAVHTDDAVYGSMNVEAALKDLVK